MAKGYQAAHIKRLRKDLTVHRKRPELAEVAGRNIGDAELRFGEVCPCTADVIIPGQYVDLSEYRLKPEKKKNCLEGVLRA
jgi:hypothetical protein